MEHFSALKKEVDGSYNAVKFDLSLLYPGLCLIMAIIEYKDLSTNTWIVLISQEELLPIIDDKIDKSKIADNLTTADASSVLSSNQGVVLKSFIDSLNEKVFPLSVNIGS